MLSQRMGVPEWQDSRWRWFSDPELRLAALFHLGSHANWSKVPTVRWPSISAAVLQQYACSSRDGYFASNFFSL